MGSDARAGHGGVHAVWLAVGRAAACVLRLDGAGLTRCDYSTPPHAQVDAGARACQRWCRERGARSPLASRRSCRTRARAVGRARVQGGEHVPVRQPGEVFVKVLD